MPVGSGVYTPDTPPTQLHQDDQLWSSLGEDTNTDNATRTMIFTLYQVVYDFTCIHGDVAKDLLLVFFVSVVLGVIARTIFNWYASRMGREDLHKKDS